MEAKKFTVAVIYRQPVMNISILFEHTVSASTEHEAILRAGLELGTQLTRNAFPANPQDIRVIGICLEEGGQ